ncbi:MAG TPA: metal-sulfur cluster assembly factor [Chitinophagaceae bacterium]|jgi:metal-sulfur cluster biosynthetic enzyme|nr:metal-sulfur cluster assembly factor [Chitinophagaceae bacterium]
MNLKSNNKIKSQIALSALRNVIDPEIGTNVVDLGLIYEIDFDEKEKSIYCTMTLTTEYCPMGETILDAATQALKYAMPEFEVEINLTFEPRWDYTMISEEAVKFLNAG